MKTMKSKKAKETRTKFLIVTAAAVLAVASSSASIAYAQTAPITTTISSSVAQKLKSAVGGITDIDAPSAGASTSGTLNIAGWALNAAGIGRVDFYALDSSGHYHGLGSVDGSKLTARQDVENAFPGYGALDSGYSLTADVSKLPAGPYVLAIAGIAKDGSVNWASKPITIGPGPLTDIDAPAGGSEQDGSITISGWALNHGGINRVDIYALDGAGHYHGLGSVGGDKLTARQDVQNVFPVFGALDSGYSLSVPSTALPAGSYTLCVASIGNDGDVRWATQSITVGPAPLTDIDAPTAGARVTNGKLNIAGWALSKSGIDRVDIYALDGSGHYHGLGSVGGDKLAARPDVQNVFPAFGVLNSGYSYTADVSTLAPGGYTLCVAAVDNNGNAKWSTSSFSIAGAVSAAPITDLDTPATTYTGTIPVYGWALNSSGLNRVDIYAYPAGSRDAIKLGSVDGGALVARQDVENAFPGYGILDSGFSYTVPAGTLAPGNYTLAVAGIGNDGSVAWATKGIGVQQVTNYQGTTVTKTYTDTITGSPEVVQFLGVGAGYQEVAVAEIKFQTTAALGAAHSGAATATLTGPVSESSPAVVGSTGTCSLFTVGNLTPGTYTVKLNASDGTVVVNFQFVVDAHGNVL